MPTLMMRSVSDTICADDLRRVSVREYVTDLVEDKDTSEALQMLTLWYEFDPWWIGALAHRASRDVLGRMIDGEVPNSGYVESTVDELCYLLNN